MTVAPLIAMKSSQVKSFDAVGRELDRRAHTYAYDIPVTCFIDPFLAQVCECVRAGAWIPMGEVLRPRPWESDIRYRYRQRFVGVVWRGEVPPSRRSRAGKEEVTREAARTVKAYDRNHAAQLATSRSRGQSR